jgi:hypothetical protein
MRSSYSFLFLQICIPSVLELDNLKPFHKIYFSSTNLKGHASFANLANFNRSVSELSLEHLLSKLNPMTPPN